MKMSYFRFFPDVICVEGNVRSTVYSFSDGNVSQLSIYESDILRMLKTESIEETELLMNKEDVSAFIQKMVSSALGTIYEENVYAETYLPHMPFELVGYLEKPLVIEELFIDMFPKDLYNLKQSKNNKEFLFQGCNFCVPSTMKSWDDEYAEKFFPVLMSNLNDISQIELKKVTFHIGNPEKVFGYLKRIIEELIQCHSDVRFEFVMYFEDLNLETLSFIQEISNSTIVICCLETVDMVILHKLCKEIQSRNIRVIVSTLLLHKDDVDYFATAKSFSESTGIQLRSTELLGPTCTCVSSVIRDSERLEMTDADGFYAKGKYSICQYGKVAIDASGNIGACLFGEKAGNLEEGLFRFFEKNMHTKLWEKPKRNYYPCNHCENRYSCVDCNCIEESIAQECNVLRYSFCSYDPDSGRWDNMTKNREVCHNVCIGGYRSD